MLPCGSIVLTRFPFSDLSGDMRRPALVVSRDNDRLPRPGRVLNHASPRMEPDIVPIAATKETGLKVSSVVRFDKLALLDRSVVVGRIGAAPADWLVVSRTVFFGLFGFAPP